MNTGDWLSNMKSVTRLMPVKEGRRWRGRKGMLFVRKTLRDGASLYHFVVDVISREVGALQERVQEARDVTSKLYIKAIRDLYPAKYT